MSDPAFLPVSMWEQGTTDNSVPSNDNALLFEISQRNVNNATTAEPVSPADGDTYIIQSTHTGAVWSTFTPKSVAIYKVIDGVGAWYARAPVEGNSVSVSGVPYIYTSGAWTAAGGGGGGSVAGSDKQVQFNDGGSFGAEAGFEYDKATNTLTVDKVNEARGSSIASASTTDIGAAGGNFVHITGTTTITALGTVAAGARRVVVFDGALTLTHNGTSLILPTGASITTAAGDTATCISEGSGNWRITSYQRKDGTALTSSGGLTGFTSTLNTASPNNTNNTSEIVASGGTTNQNAAFGSKGTGAIQAKTADSTATGGNVRGSNAVDWQQVRNNASQVASGTESVIAGGSRNIASGSQCFIGGGFNNTASAGLTSIAGGYQNNATQSYASLAGGYQCTASGQYSAVGGGHTSVASGLNAVVAGGIFNTASVDYSVVSGGYINTASGQYSFISGGKDSITRGLYGSTAHGSGQFAVQGDAQSMRFVYRRATTNATPTAVSADAGAPASATSVVLPNNSCYGFDAIVSARSNATGDSAVFRIVGAIKRVANAASTAILGTPAVTVVGADAGASTWTVSAAANTTLGSLELLVTGAASTNIRWVCSIATTEVVG